MVENILALAVGFDIARRDAPDLAFHRLVDQVLAFHPVRPVAEPLSSNALKNSCDTKGLKLEGFAQAFHWSAGMSATLSTVRSFKAYSPQR